MMTRTPLLLSAILALSIAALARPMAIAPDPVRVMTFNIEDLRPDEVMRGAERVGRAAELIRRSGASVVLINEMAWSPEGDHAAKFAQMLGGGTDHTWTYFAPPSNTGEHSGHDLDNSGSADPEQGGRAYAGDCFGYGEFPGHYAMALFVRSDVDVVWEAIRTFRTFLWKDMPGALLPPADGSGEGSWYSDEELEIVRLSSKTHMDVPVRIPGGRVVHLLCSHPTPPGFDGPEDRNGRRNHDEIRFWLEYIDGAPWIIDDAGRGGGLGAGASFIVMGDLNADPEDGDSVDRIAKRLLDHPRVNGDFVPTSAVAGHAGRRGAWDASDTARWGLRVDYVLPSVELEVLGGGVIRGGADLEGADVEGLSDHFPVWVGLGAAEGQ